MRRCPTWSMDDMLKPSFKLRCQQGIDTKTPASRGALPGKSSRQNSSMSSVTPDAGIQDLGDKDIAYSVNINEQVKCEQRSTCGKSRLGTGTQQRSDDHKIRPKTRAWLYLNRGDKGYTKKLAHIWHGPFQFIEVVGDHAVRLETQ